MRLSIITINYNNYDGLEKTINSVVSQIFKDFEWIVIDGGSTDGSRELLEQYSSCFSYWVSEPDKGIYNAMNKGIKKSHGDYLLFLNSGDWLSSPTSLDESINNQIDADVLYGNVQFFKDDVKVGERVYDDALSLKYVIDNSLAHNCSFIKRELIASIGYSEHYKIVSDKEFFLKQMLANKQFVHVNKFVSCFSLDGISSTNLELALKEKQTMIKTIVPKCVLRDCEIIDRLIESKEKFTNQAVEIDSFYKRGGLYKKSVAGLIRAFRLFSGLSKK